MHREITGLEQYAGRLEITALKSLVVNRVARHDLTQLLNLHEGKGFWRLLRNSD